MDDDGVDMDLDGRQCSQVYTTFYKSHKIILYLNNSMLKNKCFMINVFCRGWVWTWIPFKLKWR